MVVHFELHESWSQSILLADARRAGVSFGKDQHWHYQGITGIYVFQDPYLVIEIIEKPSEYTREMVTKTLRQIQARLLQNRGKTGGK
ncbi:MAG: hypothetical protein EBR73_01460 [Rhodobacteraceae bacterium]|nr:hypothetical protein [Paracoccaceae bacterium]